MWSLSLKHKPNRVSYSDRLFFIVAVTVTKTILDKTVAQVYAGTLKGQGQPEHKLNLVKYTQCDQSCFRRKQTELRVNSQNNITT